MTQINRSLNSPAPCRCCSSLRRYIAEHLDPWDTFDGSEDPAEVVTSLDRMFALEGGALVTVQEMAAYLAEKEER